MRTPPSKLHTPLGNPQPATASDPTSKPQPLLPRMRHLQATTRIRHAATASAAALAAAAASTQPHAPPTRGWSWSRWRWSWQWWSRSGGGPSVGHGGGRYNGRGRRGGRAGRGGGGHRSGRQRGAVRMGYGSCSVDRLRPEISTNQQTSATINTNQHQSAKIGKISRNQQK